MLIVLCTIAAWIPPIVALIATPLTGRRKISSFMILFLLGCGISLSNTIEAAKALLTNRDWTFKRTPKYAIQSGNEKWSDKRYQVSLDFVCLIELTFVCLGMSAIGYSIRNSNFGVLVILIPFHGCIYLRVFFNDHSKPSMGLNAKQKPVVGVNQR